MKKELLLSLIVLTSSAVAFGDDLDEIFGVSEKKAEVKVDAKVEATKAKKTEKKAEVAKALPESLPTKIVPEKKNISGIEWEDFLPARTPEQRILRSFLRGAEYEQALLQWESAFQKDDFSKTDAGLATYGYIQYVNGLRLNGVEILFKVRNPSGLPSGIVKPFQAALKKDPLVWQQAEVSWNSQWTNLFGEEAEIAVRSRQVDGGTPSSELLALAKKTKKGSKEHTWLQWELALAFADEGNVKNSAKLLKLLVDLDQDVIDRDQIRITIARLLFEAGYLEQAISFYEQITPSSEIWFDAQEEIAWSYLRLAQPQNAMARVKNLSANGFESLLGAETLYVKGVSHLKVCDYPEVVDVIQDFKKIYKPKTEQLTALKANGETAQSRAFVEAIKKGETQWKTLARNAKGLPRFVSRDRVLKNKAKLLSHLEAEVNQANIVYHRSLTGGSDQVGFQAAFGELKNRLEQRQNAIRHNVYGRISELATEELGEIERIMKGLNIVEAELIQQVALAKSVEKNASSTARVLEGKARADGSDVLTFPYDGEIWLDEINHYKVDLKKSCQGRGTGV